MKEAQKAPHPSAFLVCIIFALSACYGFTVVSDYFFGKSHHNQNPPTLSSR